MLRSLYTGISSLRNHQTMMDVTSHNIANVNTTGYKTQRVTLKEGFSQMLRGATRPAGNAGGTNPMQIGLGMSIGSIDSIMDQGSLQSTGQITDLAVEGRGFFAFTNGQGGTFYGRNGALQLNSDGVLVSPNNGFALLGLTADAEGRIPHTAVPGPIRLPFGEKAPARATENIDFVCNLNTDSAGRGSWIHTAAFLTAGAGDDLLIGLHDGRGNSFNMQPNDMLRIAFKPGPDAEDAHYEFRVEKDTTLSDLAAAIQTALRSEGAGTATVTVTDDGRINIENAGTALNLAVTNQTRPTSNSFVANTFQWPGSVSGLSVGRTLAGVTTETTFVRLDASGDTIMDGGTPPRPVPNIFDAHGQPIRITDGTEIKIGANIGNVSIGDDPDGGLIFSDGTGTSDATNMGDLLQYLQFRLRLPDNVHDNSGHDISSVQINTHAEALVDPGESRAPVGSIVIRGQTGSGFAITGLSISVDNLTNEGNFNANTSPTTFQQAREVAVHSTSIEVFDESGAAHTVTMTFTPTQEPGRWLWEIFPQDGQIVLGGNRGTLHFAEDGSPQTWLFDDRMESTFRFRPMNGSADLSIRLNVGENGTFSGITQFNAATSTTASGQDGYTMGKLSEIMISENGEISGLYSNGVTRMMATILLAEFNNPAGLLRAGDSMWAESSNSGHGTLFTPGHGTSSRIKPGALEMSNVDLASEFTDLITTQRGYQASARVISTSDQLLQELVQLVR